MLFKSACVNISFIFCAVPLTVLPLPQCMVYANVVLLSNSGSFLPDILPLFHLNSVCHTEAS